MSPQLMMIATIAVALLIVSMGVHRVHVFRRGGTDVVLRDLPAPAGHGWHHGVLRYRERDLMFFRLSRLRPGPERVIVRRSLELLDKRDPAPAERGVVARDCTVVRFEHDGTHSEIALNRGALTAFLSWVESSPPGRARRGVTH